MTSRTLASSRNAAGTQGTSWARETESPLAKRVTSWPSRTSSSVKYETIRSVPPYSRGGTLSMSGAICAIFILLDSTSRHRRPNVLQCEKFLLVPRGNENPRDNGRHDGLSFRVGNGRQQGDLGMAGIHPGVLQD